ncbi:MAG: ATP-dependent sacrificial sulfur transferase LarE [Candidatus Aminicenantes bacterium]|nr:MAG: ATP-dependent sacrificial sulfur transferase LarE [Candidatus Aminicenantes bacterium]
MSAKKSSSNIQAKYKKLKGILEEMGSVLVAFSGGVDSSFLLKTANEVLGDEVFAVIASSETYPEKEKEEAIKIAQYLNVRYKIIRTRELENPDFVNNSPQRCYFCKRVLFSRLKEIAEDEGISCVIDGANLEDTGDYRPGSIAAEELGIRSPLKEARFIKSEIRKLSKQLGLPTWNKPSMACLASRFPYYMRIDMKSLKRVSQAEDFLRALGFSQIRVRHHGQIARIEIEPKEFPEIMEKGVREKIVKTLKKLGYTYITIDLAGYRTGSMNEPLSSAVKRKT